MAWKKIKNKEITEVKKFKEEKPARLPAALYEFEKTRYKLGVHATRLLLMTSQTVSKTPKEQTELYPLEYPLDVVFKYLGLEKDNRRYEILADACAEFRQSGLDIKTQTKRGGTRWVGVSFIDKYEFSTDSPALRLRINDDAKEFLCNLHQYALLQPKYYLKLSTEYQNWFYPYLKMRHLLGQWEVDIKDLLFMLYLEKTPSYTTDQKANYNFFKRVIGIEKPKGWKYNPKGKNKPWDYAKDANGNYIGTLASISIQTDLNVSAYPIMEKGKYVAVHFDLSIKAAKLTKIEKTQIHTQAVNAAEQDMGKRKKEKRAGAQTMKDIFESTPLVDEQINPLAPTEDIPEGVNVISKETVIDMAREAHMRTTDFATKMGYKQREDGDFEQKNI